jgi:RNA recognition motif-containing protein
MSVSSLCLVNKTGYFYFEVDMNIFVGNLSYTTTEESIRTLFEPYGEVTSAKIINDRETGRSRGFSFVDMPNDSEGRAAIAALNGRDLDGRSIRVSESEGRPERSSRPSGGYGGGGRSSGGGGFRSDRPRNDSGFRRDRG